MKIYFLMTFVWITANANAQEHQPDINKLIARSKLSTLKNDSFRVPPKPSVFNTQKIVPGVYALPQDGMPCMVPDTQSIAAMPNAAKENNVPPANRIPNAMPRKQPLLKEKMNSK